MVLIVLTFNMTRAPDSYDNEIIHKKMLLASAPSPRIIFVGGSGVAFSLDTALVGSSTNLYPVNLGMYATLGLDNLLRQADEGTRKGDTVVIIPEYRLLEDIDSFRGVQLLGLIQADIHFARYLGNKRDIASMLGALPLWCEQQIEETSSRLHHYLLSTQDETMHRMVYRESNFNSYGDMLGHLQFATQSERVWKEAKLAGHVSPSVTKSLTEFIESAKKKGFTVRFSWPAFSRSSYEENSMAIDQLSSDIKIIFGKDNVLGEPSDFVWSDNNFFDSVYHLLASARAEHSHKIARLLNASFNQQIGK